MKMFTDVQTVSIDVFDRYESDVRSYIRSFPTVFHRAKDYHLWDVDGTMYIDFFAGAGALNYGHNNEVLKRALLEYLSEDGITHGLDMGTKAKGEFLEAFQQIILEPRGLSYKVMFPGPTGTNSVESALKLARKVTGRSTIISFTNAFHGMTLGSLSVTGNRFKRKGAGIPLSNTFSVPYDSQENGIDGIALLRRMLDDSGSGLDLPAAIIVETVQGEGGINVASLKWLKQLETLCRARDILLILDDVQMGCGRTGPFFSFESAGITPDIVCLSKSISGYGLPMALTLFRPELDVWNPGEHNGTFRGHNPAFVTGTQALKQYWTNQKLTDQTEQHGRTIEGYLSDIVESMPTLRGKVRGRGMAYGMECGVPGLAEEISHAAFERGLIVETSGAQSEVVKLLPPLTIDEVGLKRGLSILADSAKAVAPI
ncbi:diaminobutyrate--2-oxoglutarate transaminase [Alicyclobacillus mengziensis]|uniref:Diaminobutyrate--2-oxoglutarate transaminase n=2 Tax=Alicyclobacillus mengziensis TaxID=2931921 RepID=A0A9X7VZA3_9BACL|nr:diaminobutyrate--2-oxoglutarate transaminase [Alicyclobacillus mengziensis]QSO47848.1 diaminobutyrate--2-oxoglutarate transaminase [Alicyclobacillus mengziensis]